MFAHFAMRAIGSDRPIDQAVTVDDAAGAAAAASVEGANDFVETDAASVARDRVGDRLSVV